MNVTSQLSYITLSALYLSTCLASTPPLSSAHDTHAQRTHTDKEDHKKEGEKRNQTERNETVPAARLVPTRDNLNMLPLLTSHFYNSLDKDGRDELEFLRRGYYPPRPRPRNASTPVEERNVGVESALHEITVSVLPLSPPPPELTCASLTCTWFTSWHFASIAFMMTVWLLALTTLLCLAQTSRGRHLLDVFSSCCAKKSDPDAQVLAKGIGYFDGSPGMRRFVLIEDEDEDEDANSITDSQKDTEDTEVETRTSESSAKAWRPPRKGTYILQEATKDYVLELGTYRLQEETNEDVEEDKVEYVLEGATYILRSERVARETEVVEEVGGEGGNRSDIENLYKYGIIGRGKERGLREIEGLYGIIKQGETGELGGTRGQDGVLLSVSDLERGEHFKSKEIDKSELMGAEGGAVEVERLRSRSALSAKRAYSFPMDSYQPVRLLPRKLSLIMEEEMH